MFNIRLVYADDSKNGYKLHIDFIYIFIYINKGPQKRPLFNIFLKSCAKC